MLAEHLPPLFASDGNENSLMGEAWALTHLAYYATSGLTARSTESFKRSYAMDSIAATPRVPGGRPGFVVSKWDSDDIQKIVIAIEGATDWQQILQISEATALANFGAVANRRILQLFETYRGEISVQLGLAGVPAWIDSKASARVVFAGHSLGAAMAELLAEGYAALYPNRYVSCYKFGAPRIGNEVHVNNLLPLYNRLSVYAHTDPIQLIPNVGIPRNAAGAFATNLPVGFLRPDGRGRGIGDDGLQSSPYESLPLDQVIRIIAQVNAASVPSNPWYWHHRNAYRYVISQLFPDRLTMEPLRFRHWELPDENSWGYAYRRNQGITEAMLAFGAPAPADQPTGYVAPPLSGAHRAARPQAETGRGVENIHRGEFRPPNPREHGRHQWLPSRTN